MANQITDNRTSISANDTNANIDDAAGAANGNTNTETFVEGLGSVSVKVSSATDALLYDFGSAQNFANNTFYFWWACSTAGKLDTLANGGVRIRFCGATVTDYFEIHVAGKDTYTGGFTMSVIDIERAYTAAVTNGDANTGTGGTPPATSAIRYAGVFFDVTAMISGNVDNCFIDAFWRLPQNTPGIIVEGRNGGTTDWTFEDIFDAGDPGDTTKAWGTGFRESNGSLTFNTPIQIGINDTTTHAFTDSNVLVGWQDQFVNLTTFYSITLLGNAGGTTDFTLGVVSGTGNDRVGTQGGVIFAPSDGPRWSIDADDANVDSCNLYGLTMTHGEDFQLDDASCNVVGSTWLDCTSAIVSNADIVGCAVINANTADGVAFMTTDDLGDIVNSNFVFSDGHAIECTSNTVDPQALTGCTFTGYGSDTTNDAALYFTYTGTLTVNVNDGSVPTYRDAGTATTTLVSGAVTLTINVSDITTGSALANARVVAYAAAGGPLNADDPITITRSGSTATVTHTAHGLATNDIVAIEGCIQGEYNGLRTVTVTGANTYTYTVSGTPATPATGSPVSSDVIINGLTDGTGTISDTRSYGSNQPIRGFVRKSSSSPVYQTSPLAGNTVLSASGATINVQLIRDS